MHASTTALNIQQLVEQFYQPLFRFAASLSGNPSDACDLTQQTFYIAQTRSHQLRDRRKVKTWLFTTLMREFLQRRRHETKFPKYHIDLVEHELPKVAADHVAGMDAQEVLAALGKLEEPFRRPLVLFYLHDLSYKEIAAELNLPIGTVMSRLARGKAQLRQKLEQLR